MSERIALKATPREMRGRSGTKKLRASGRVPAVLYGSGDPQNLELITVEFIEAFQQAESENVLVDLTIEGEKSGSKAHLALIQEIQHHPIKDTVLHIDFHEVRQDQTIQAHVPVHEEGIPEGVKNGGGILDHLIRDLHVECLPKDLPGHLSVDVSHLKLEESLTVSQMPLPDGVKALQDPELPVFMVHPPRVKETSDGADDASPKEPEVIGQKKEESENAEN